MEQGTLKIYCHGCGSAVRVPVSWAGKEGRCPHCGAHIRVPSAALFALEGVECDGCGQPLSLSEVIHVYRFHVYCEECYEEVLASETRDEGYGRREAKTRYFVPAGDDARATLRQHVELAADKELSAALVAQRLITQQTAQAIRSQVAESGKSFLFTLIASGLVSEKEIGSALARHTGLPFSTASLQYVDKGVKELLPTNLLLTYELLPLSRSLDTVTVAMTNPLDAEAKEEITRLTGLSVNVVICTYSSYRNTLRRYFGVDV